MRHARRPIPLRRSFTLVEMLTVVVIIVLILGMAIPGFTRTWEERKHAQAITTLHGVLATAQARARRTSERGLFFFIDPTTRRQVIIPIVPDPPDDDPASHEYRIDCEEPDSIRDCITEAMAVNRFRVTEGDLHELPAPIRVAPRNIVEKEGEDELWPEEDIAHDVYTQPAPEAEWPRHRNFFTVIFGPDGELIAGRDVIIHDTALRDPNSGEHFPNPVGYRTGLAVDDPTNYYTNNPEDGTETVEFDSVGSDSLYDILVDDNATAVNFTSVDGLLVYDENTLAETPYTVGQSYKRQYFLEHAQPLYVSRLTGEILEGPRGENE